MATDLKEILEQARLTASAVSDFARHLAQPTVRLGITGLSGAGKTVFITALVHALTQGGRFPVFEALASGRIARARLAPQPDDTVPRFDYEAHWRDLVEARRWPQSTRQISELRLIIDYQSARGAARKLTLDLVDYPGEWLLDLVLLEMTFAEWSALTLRLSREPARRALAKDWHAHLSGLDGAAVVDEVQAVEAARLFTAYLRACRDQRHALSLLPPGRFLMPGDLAGSPALTFAPLETPKTALDRQSLWALMDRRFEVYKDQVVRPFFRQHIARLDRQVVLIDALAALNAGPAALTDLENTLADILRAFRPGRSTILSSVFRPRISRIAFAAAKADLLHQQSHDRLERLMARLIGRARERAQVAGAMTDVIALAAVRATREAEVTAGGERLDAIVGVPEAGERLGAETFDGERELAIFPGELPEDPDVLLNNTSAFAGTAEGTDLDAAYRFVRFRPPSLTAQSGLPHVRLDRALQFLLGDRLT
jgi:predicted YcjX-like family ATPase